MTSLRRHAYRQLRGKCRCRAIASRGTTREAAETTVSTFIHHRRTYDDHYLCVSFALARLQKNLSDRQSTGRSGYFGFLSSRRDRKEVGPPAVADGVLNSLASVQVDFEWATKLNRLTLSAIGVWPNPRGDARGRLLSDLRVWFSVLLFVSVGAIPAIHSLVRTRSDMMATVDNLQFTLPLLTTTMKVIVVWWKRTGEVGGRPSR